MSLEGGPAGILPFQYRLSAVATGSIQHPSHGIEDIPLFRVAAVDPNWSARILEESKQVEKAQFNIIKKTKSLRCQAPDPTRMNPLQPVRCNLDTSTNFHTWCKADVHHPPLDH